MKITKKGCKHQCKIVTDVKKKKQKKENMDEINTNIFLKKTK